MVHFFPTLNYVHEIWVSTERIRLWKQAAEMSFLQRVAGFTPTDKIRSLSIHGELGVEPHIKGSLLRWFRHLNMMPTGRLLVGAFRARPTGRRPQGRPRTRWRDYISVGLEIPGDPP